VETLLSNSFFSFLFIAIGLSCLFLELFIVSFGVLGTVGAGCCIFGIYGLFHQEQFLLAWIAILGTVGGSFWSVRYWLKKMYHRTALQPDVSTRSNESIDRLLGTEGKTLSELRPAGIAIVDGKKVDVVSAGSFIPTGTPIRVVDTSGNRIVVQKRATDDHD